MSGLDATKANDLRCARRKRGLPRPAGSIAVWNCTHLRGGAQPKASTAAKDPQ